MKTPDFYQENGEIVESPAKWSGGQVWHTGGGIYCRSWERELPDGRKIEVIYSADKTGIGVNHYPDTDKHGADDCIKGAKPDKHSDQAYAKAARMLMRTINMVVQD